MKKVIKISLAVVAALFLFLNVSLNLNGNKVDSINMTLNFQTAMAEELCYIKLSDGYCYCKQGELDGRCVATCVAWVYRCSEIIIEGK